MLKKTLEQIAVTFIALYFLADAVSKLFDVQKEAWILNYKSQQIETALHNSGLLPFQFVWLTKELGTVITFAVGILQFLGASGFLFYED
jgi:hypothetical protein